MHYFSRPDFMMPANDNVYKRLPVRTVYSSVKLVDGVLKPFTHTHDYHQFTTYVNDDHAFKTPSGVFCDKRKPSKSVPNLKSTTFGFSQEITAKTVQYLKNYKQFFSVSRFEIRNKMLEEATLYSRNPLIFVTDNSIGVQYVIDKTIGNCTIRPVKDYAYDKVLPDKYDTALDFITKLQASGAFLQSNASYIYTGKRRDNGISVDRYITKIASDVYEYTFSDENFVAVSQAGVEQFVPVSLYIDSYRPGYGSHSSFFQLRPLPIQSAEARVLRHQRLLHARTNHHV